MPRHENCESGPLRPKFYAKIGTSVTYVQFQPFLGSWPDFCGLAHRCPARDCVN
jgi:hypothetical protein